jgi:hypothetical protein
MVREQKSSLHAWATSSSWDSKREVCTPGGEKEKRYVMDANFVKQIHGNIYEAKINAFIPWALSQRAAHWNKPDPNPGSAFRVYEDSTWEIKKGYYYYKQVTRAGKPGKKVVRTSCMDSEIAIIGFAKGESLHENAFVVINFGDHVKELSIRVNGARAYQYKAYRTSGSEVYEYYQSARDNLTGENYKPLGNFMLDQENELNYAVPPNSVTTFYETIK